MHIDPLIEICLLRRGPQDLPPSLPLRRLALTVYAIIGLVSGIVNQTFEVSIQLTLIDVLLLVALTYFALWLRRRPERMTQTVTALAGCGVVLGIISLPLLTLHEIANTDIRAVVELLLFALLIWQIVVYSHILRHALAIPYFFAVILTVLYAMSMFYVMAVIISLQG